MPIHYKTDKELKLIYKKEDFAEDEGVPVKDRRAFKFHNLLLIEFLHRC